jgi:4-hydroxy-3-methylbut-2-enyl diphosphate reductase IspH
VGSQAADSGNWLATLNQQQELASLCNSNELVAVCHFPKSANSEKSIAVTKYRTNFQQKLRDY